MVRRTGALGLMAVALGFAPVGARVDQSMALPSVELPDELERVPRDYEVAWADGDAAALAAYLIGAYAYDEDGDRGKFVLALRRDDARWYIAADMDNPIR